MPMGDSSFSLADTTLPDATLRLRVTASTDPDVLFAAKTEYARPYTNQRVIGLVAMVVGVFASLTIVLAIVGVPLAIVGFWLWRKGIRNLTLVDAAYTQYMAGLTRRPGPSAAPAVPI